MQKFLPQFAQILRQRAGFVPRVHSAPVTTAASSIVSLPGRSNATVRSGGIDREGHIKATETEITSVDNVVIEHVFIRFDYKSSIFNNSLTISMPENTPIIVVETANQSLKDALKDRPTGQDYSDAKLSTPEFVQTGIRWNRYMWNLLQREVEGSLDPYTVQGIILDALANRLNAKIVGNTSLGRIGNESYTYIISIPVTTLDYTYKRL